MNTNWRNRSLGDGSRAMERVFLCINAWDSLCYFLKNKIIWTETLKTMVTSEPGLFPLCTYKKLLTSLKPMVMIELNFSRNGH